MNTANDIFQRLIGLANSTDEQSRQPILECIRDLEAADLREPGGAENVIAAGRIVYLGLLAERARMYLNRARPIFTKHSQSIVVSPIGPEGEELREFYHAAYYSVFFIARWALVKNHGYDCSYHKDIEKVLVKHFRGKPQEELASITAFNLGQMRDYRNVADYILNFGKLNRLSDQGQIQSTMKQVESAATSWGIP